MRFSSVGCGRHGLNYYSLSVIMLEIGCWTALEVVLEVTGMRARQYKGGKQVLVNTHLCMALTCLSDISHTIVLDVGDLLRRWSVWSSR